MDIVWYRIKNQEWFIKYCTTDARLQRYSGNVFTTNNITNSVMTAQWR